MIRAVIAAILLALVLAGCGGGGGSSAPTGAIDPPKPRSEALHYGYFGLDDSGSGGDNIAEIADHVDFVLAPDWGDYFTPGYDEFRIAQMIEQLQKAQARGIKQAWVMPGFLLFYGTKGCNAQCLTPRPDGMARLAYFRTQLQALGLDGMVKAFYIDEPELYGLNDATLAPVVQQVKAAWPALFVLTYSDRGQYPGKDAADVICTDQYGAGADVLNRMPEIRPDQKRCLIPGGASGLSNHGPDDPQPFYDYAMAHDNVYAILPFVWFDRNDNGRLLKGIRSNGMAPAYRAIGCKATSKC